jgi:hypothetical protein
MVEQREDATGDWVVVRRPGVVRLVGSVVRAHNASTLTRLRGDTMIALAETLAASQAGAVIESTDPDGAWWSMKITTKDSHCGTAD